MQNIPHSTGLNDLVSDTIQDVESITFRDGATHQGFCLPVAPTEYVTALANENSQPNNTVLFFPVDGILVLRWKKADGSISNWLLYRI